MLKYSEIREIHRLGALDFISCFNAIRKGSQIEWLWCLCFYSTYRNKRKTKNSKNNSIKQAELQAFPYCRFQFVALGSGNWLQPLERQLWELLWFAFILKCKGWENQVVRARREASSADALWGCTPEVCEYPLTDSLVIKGATEVADPQDRTTPQIYGAVSPSNDGRSLMTQDMAFKSQGQLASSLSFLELLLQEPDGSLLELMCAMCCARCTRLWRTCVLMSVTPSQADQVLSKVGQREVLGRPVCRWRTGLSFLPDPRVRVTRIKTN